MAIDNTYKITPMTGKGVRAQYSVNGTSSWHDDFTAGDLFMKTSTDSGKTWSGAMRIVGETGSDGLGTWTSVLNGVSREGSTFTKTSSTNAWDSQFYSLEGFPRAYVSFTAASTEKYLMVGLNSDPATSGDYRDIDYAIYLRDSDMNIYESGSPIGKLDTFVAGDTFRVEYDGLKVKYYKNDVLKRSIDRTESGLLWADSSFKTPNSKVTNVSFGTIGKVGASGYTYEIDCPSVFKAGDTPVFSFYKVESGTRTEASVYYKITPYTNAGEGTVIAGTGTSYTCAAVTTQTKFKCEIFKSDTDTVSLDVEEIELISDGLQVSVLNDNISINCDSAGYPKTALSTSIKVGAYRGGKRVAGTISSPSTTTNATCTITSNPTASADGVITVSQAITKLGASGTISFNVTVDGTDFSKSVNVSVTKDGDKGDTGDTGAATGAQILRATNESTAINSSSTWTTRGWRNHGGGTGTRTCIEITDCPNPAIKYGWKLQRTSTANTDSICISQLGIPLIAGKSYTISCYARKSSSSSAEKLFLRWRPDESSSTGQISRSIALNTEWQLCSTTINITKGTNHSIAIGSCYGTVLNDYVEICGMKVEIGGTATYWCEYESDKNGVVVYCQQTGTISLTNDYKAPDDINLYIPFSVYKNGKRQVCTADWSYSNGTKNLPDGISYIDTTAGTATSDGVIHFKITKGTDFSSIKNDNICIIITYDGVKYTQYYVWSVSPAGDSGYTYEIDCPIVFKRKETVTANAYIAQDGTRTSATVYWEWDYYSPDDKGVYSWKTAANKPTASSCTTTALNVSTKARFRIYPSSKKEYLLDMEELSLVADDTTVIEIGNDNITLGCDKDGKLKSNYSETVKVASYYGTSQVASVITEGDNTSNMTVGTITNGTSSADGTISLSLTAGTPVTEGTIKFSITANGVTIEKTINISTSSTGATGATGTKIFYSDYTQREWDNSTWNTGSAKDHPMSPAQFDITGMRVGDTLVIPVILTEQNNIMGAIYAEITSIPTSKVSGETYYAVPCKTLYSIVGYQGEKGDRGYSSRTLAVRVNYSAFSTASNGSIYVCGYNDDGNEADVNGYVIVNGTKYNVKGAMINNLAVSGWIGFDKTATTTPRPVAIYRLWGDSNFYVIKNDITLTSAVDKGDWKASTSYAVNNIVKYNNNYYACKTANLDSTFTVSKWNLISEKIATSSNYVIMGEILKYSYNGTVTYKSLDPVLLSSMKPNWEYMFSGITGNVYGWTTASYNTYKIAQTKDSAAASGYKYEKSSPGSITFRRGFVTLDINTTGTPTKTTAAPVIKLFNGTHFETVTTGAFYEQFQVMMAGEIPLIAGYYDSIEGVDVPAICGTYIRSLTCNRAFINQLFANEININDGGAIQSNGYTTTADKGFQIKADGTATFQGATVKGEITATKLTLSNTKLAQSDITNLTSDLSKKASTTSVTNITDGTTKIKANITTGETTDEGVAISGGGWTDEKSTTGFGIMRNGDAYFNNGNFRGDLDNGVFSVENKANKSFVVEKITTAKRCYEVFVKPIKDRIIGICQTLNRSRSATGEDYSEKFTIQGNFISNFDVAKYNSTTFTEISLYSDVNYNILEFFIGDIVILTMDMDILKETITPKSIKSGTTITITRKITNTNLFTIKDLPTYNPLISGVLWNENGNVVISDGTSKSSFKTAKVPDYYKQLSVTSKSTLTQDVYVNYLCVGVRTDGNTSYGSFKIDNIEVSSQSYGSQWVVGTNTAVSVTSFSGFIAKGSKVEWSSGIASFFPV